MKNSQWKSIIITTLTVLFLAVTLGTGLCSYRYYSAAIVNHKIIGGIKFNNIDLTGYPYSKVETLIKNSSANLLKQPINLVYDKYQTIIYPKDILAKTNYKTILTNILRENKEKGIICQLKQILNLPQKTKEYMLKINYSNTILVQSIDDIKRNFSVIPVNAKIYARNKKIYIEPEIIGKRLNCEKLYNEVSLCLSSSQKKRKQITVPFDDIIPEITAAKLNELKISDLLVSFQTNYDINTIGRSENIQTGIEKINSYLLRPQEIFSFNSVVGPRTMQNGYRQAPEIVNGKLQPGIGGGICQVATTLYNAVLLADLRIIKRAHHSRPLQYVPAGLDATVSYNSIDFVFKNICPYPIMLAMYAQNGILTAEVYGQKKDDNRSVEVYTTDLKEYPFRTIMQQDPDMYNSMCKIAQEGVNGCSVNVWRAIKVDGREIAKEAVSKDHYNPVDMIVITGTKE